MDCPGDASEETWQDLVDGEFAFIDLGCSNGTSIEYCESRFGKGRGVGFDIDAVKVERARASGRRVIRCDLTRGGIPEGCVDFCAMMDFLEHVPSEQHARSILQSASRAARDFLFIRHPSFEDIGYLSQLGLKISWTDWRGHTNMMRLADFESFFREVSWTDYAIIPRKRIRDSSHEAVVPADAPIDTVRYSEAEHGPKDLIVFDREIFTQFDIFVRLNADFSETEWNSIVGVSSGPAAAPELAAPRAAGASHEGGRNEGWLSKLRALLRLPGSAGD